MCYCISTVTNRRVDFVVVRIEGSMFFERLFGNFRNLYNSTTDNNNARELQMYYCKLLSNLQKHLRALHKKCTM